MSKRVSGHRRRGLPRLASVRAAAGAGRTRCSASTISSPARARNIAHLLGNPRFELMRHDVTLPALRRGRRDLQPRLPGLADPLPARSGADDQDQRARRDQHARPRQAREGARSCRPRPARSTATRPCIRRPRATGATSTRSARAPATTKASAAPRRCSSTTAASTASRSRSRASSTPTARACIRTTAAWCPTSSSRRCRASRLTIYGDGSQTRSFCYVDDLIEGFMRLMATDRRRHRPDQPRQSRRVHHPRAGRDGRSS